ncbi:MAG: bifunctional methylenetetrahydrofolate dehydrogenase/methenyltetrahydrofolate cyclohydrolase FolD [Acidobacteriota bacterium]
MQKIMNGKEASDEILEKIKIDTENFVKKGLRPPGLAAVLIGENPASKIYVGSKVRTCANLGFYSEKIEKDKNIEMKEVLNLIKDLNEREEIDGILVQLPLPDHLDESMILEAVNPQKDVDGFHPQNLGKLFIDEPNMVPCTPLGIMALLKKYNVELKGRNAVVVGRSRIVGKPLSLLLLKENATVTICHSKTANLEEITSKADILVAAMGKKAFLTHKHIKEGAVVVDVGINRVTDIEEAKKLYPDDEARWNQVKEKGSTLVGDVFPPAMKEKASLYTPVPGGVGPLTIAGLMMNTFLSYSQRVK